MIEDKFEPLLVEMQRKAAPLDRSVQRSITIICLDTERGGRHSTEVAFALLTPPTRVRFSAFPRNPNFLRFMDCSVLLSVWTVVEKA